MTNWATFKKKKKSKVTIYNSQKKGRPSPKNAVNELDLAWTHYFVKNAPNGIVLKKSTDFFEKVKNRSYLDFVHVTPSLKKIVEEKRMQASSGGLGYAIYCSLLNENNISHNIVDQYLNFQLKFKYDNPTIIIIRLKPQKKFSNQFSKGGIDYTELGETNLQAFSNICPRLNSALVENMFSDIQHRVKAAMPTLNVLISYKMSKVSGEQFKELHAKLFTILPELRFVLYEILAEFVLLYQTNDKSVHFRNLNELYNKGHKQIVYKLCPHMFHKFEMTAFYAQIDEIVTCLSESNLFLKFDSRHFYRFMKWRLAFYVLKIFGKSVTDSSIETLLKDHKNALGQIIYRHNPKIKGLIEIERARLLKNNWRRTQIIIPYYSILPKGELGINPDLDYFKIPYEIYFGTFNKKKSKINFRKRLMITIDNQLISKEKTSVR